MVPLITTTKPLPFHTLSPLEFERMCLWLIERKGYLRPEHLGEGGSEQGRDIIAYKPTDAGEELWYFQCKRYQKIGASTLKVEVDKYNKLAEADPTKRPVGVIFITTAVLTAQNRDTVAAYCERYDYAYDFWAHTKLDMYVKEHTDIVKEFFGPSLASTLTLSALHQLPPPLSDFTGRKSELAELTTVLERDEVTIVGLYGLGGVGKTALALKLADQLASHYPDAQFYLDLRGTSPQPLSTSEIMRHIIRAYHPTTELSDKQAELKAQYHSVLHGQRAILLLDNAANSQQIAPLIPPTSCVLLITSRRRFILPGLLPKKLDVLPPADAHELLWQIAARIGDYASQLAKQCSYLPLALRLAASALAERIDLSPADYVRRLTNAKQRLKLVDASLNLSYELLETDMQQWWCMLAVFPNSFDYDAAAAVWNVEPDSAKDILSELVAYSLVEWNPILSRYHLYELTRLFADAHLSQANRCTGQKRHAEYYLEVLTQAARLYQQGGESTLQGLALFDLEWANFQTGQSWVAANMGSGDEVARLCNDYPDRGGYLLDLRRHPQEHIQWIEVGLDAARYLKNRLAQETHLGNMGMAYFRLGDVHQAMTLYKQSLGIAYEMSDWNGITRMLLNIAAAYTTLGNVKQAMSVYEQIEDIQSEITDQDLVHGFWMNLGVAHCIMGNVQEAISICEQLLDVERELGNWRAEGLVLGNLSNVYADLGET